MGGHLGNTESTAGKSVHGKTQSLKKKEKSQCLEGTINNSTTFIFMIIYF